MKYNRLKILTLAVVCLLIPLSLPAMEYQHTLDVNDMHFSWTIDADQIHVQVSAKTTGWVGIGFDPEKAMQGANIIIGAVKNGKVKIEDHYADRKRGHSNDKKFGGKPNILNPSGTEVDGITTISFSYPLDTGDAYDKPINAQGATRIMLAYGAGRDSFKNRHPFRTVYDIDLSTGENKKIK